jgi:predicted DNA-binding protein (UPF0251 family)
MPFDIEVVRELVKSGKSAAEVSQIIGEPRTSVWRYVDKNDLGPWIFSRQYDLKPVPDDFVEKAGSMTGKDAQAYWRCSKATASRWYKQTGIKPAPRKSTMIVIPQSELAKVEGMKIADAAKKLGVSVGVASRAMKNMPRAARPKMARSTVSQKPANRRATTHNKPQGTPPAPINRYQRDMSLVGQAADFLRPLGPISREGDKWRRGSTLLTSEEIIERASWKGWKPVGLGY